MLGIIDSGVGGLTYVRAIRTIYPTLDICYFGDSAHAPYGNRSKDEIHTLTLNCIDFMRKHGVKTIIMACNTMSSEALRQIQQTQTDIKCLGVLIPACEDAIKICLQKKIAILGTKYTIASGAYKRELEKLDVNVQLVECAMPELVPIIERGDWDESEIDGVLESYRERLYDKNIGGIILGCTHFPIVEKHIAKIVYEDVQFVNSSQSAALKLPSYLARHPEVKKNLTWNGKFEIYTSGDKTIYENILQYLKL